MKKKTILVAAIAVMLVAALVVGGTLAYFTDTKSADNVFTMGNVAITLDETDVSNPDARTTRGNTYNVYPGQTVKKDPIVHNTGAEEQAHAQEHGRTEDERENTFFHVFVLLSQAVGIGSICVLEVLASTVPTCFHASMGPYLSRFAVWTASAVT